MSPNGRHPCSRCGAILLHWGDPCWKCGATAEQAEGKEEKR